MKLNFWCLIIKILLTELAYMYNISDNGKILYVRVQVIYK